MNLLLLRILFVISSMVMGYSLMSVRASGLLGILLGGVIALVLVFIEIGMRKISVTGLSSVVFGLIFGLIMAKLVGDAISLAQVEARNVVCRLACRSM